MATMIMLMLRSLILMLMVPTRCLAPLAAPPLPPGLSTCPRWTFLIILHRSKYISSLTSQSLIDHLSLLLLMQQGQRWPSDHDEDLQLTIPPKIFRIVSPTNQCVMFPISTPFLNPIPQVLHLSDLHVQLGYKEGAASTCGKYPVCCLPGLGVTSFLTFIKQSIIHWIWEQEKAANIKNHRQHCRTHHLHHELESGANTPATFLLGLSTGCLETSQSVILIYPGL